MSLKKLSFEHILFLLALLLGLGVRLLNLGAAPLSDTEATWALQALGVATNQPLNGVYALGPQPAYVILSGLTFALFGSSNFAARLWPALAGSLLILAPFFFRRYLGRRAALILAFGLALDPGLVAVSRQAGGPIMALAFVILALGFWFSSRPVWAGLFGGLALLSGPGILLGLLSLALALGIARLLESAHLGNPLQPWRRSTGSDSLEHPDSWKRLFISAGVTIFLVGTLFFWIPQGLSAWFDTLPAYLSGWVQSSGIPPLRVAAALIFFQPLALVFGLIGAARSWIPRNNVAFDVPDGTLLQDDPPRERAILPTLWAVISFILIMLYASRQTADLIWVLLPLWVLAAMELSRYLPEDMPHPVSLIQAGLVLILFALFWNTLNVLHLSIPGVSGPGIQSIVLVGILVLGLLVTLLVALGWSWEISRHGLVWGSFAGLFLFTLSAMFGASQVRPNQPQELWSQPPAAGQVGQLVTIMGDLSQWHVGNRQLIDGIVTVQDASLRWALRDFTHVRFVSALLAEDKPAVLITPQGQEDPTLASAYRGHNFIWWVSPGWDGALPPDFVAWLTFKDAPLTERQIILWARSDIFPGESGSGGDNPQGQP